MKLYQVDAFSKSMFKGNPAAVCLLSEKQPDSWMRSLAQEMNLSETAFLEKTTDGYSLRWFTPTREVELCGHATLATAHILYSESHELAETELRFQTRSGLLTARLIEGQIALDFPGILPSPVTAKPEILNALGLDRCLDYQEARHHTVIRLENPQQVQDLRPDFLALEAVSSGLVMATAAGTGDFDFVSRVFATYAGINEDPVTGAAHCCLTPYWDGILGRSGGTMRAYQASERGGELTLASLGSRVSLRGFARTVFQGELLVDP